MTHVSSKQSSLPVRQRFYSKLSQIKWKNPKPSALLKCSWRNLKIPKEDGAIGIREGLNMMVGFRAETNIIYVIFRPEQTSRFTHS